ncbi:MAG: PqiC family protein [Solimonas sp.]
MIRALKGLTSALLPALLLAACSKDDPTRYYTLVRPLPAPALAGRAAFAIDVQPVRVPPQVNLPELVVRQGDGEVAVVESRLWVAPLPDEMRGALAAEMSRRLGVPDVSQVAPPAGAPVYRVLVDVQRFDAQLAGSVRLDAVWTVTDLSGGAQARWTCADSATTSVAAGYPALVEGTQQGLAQLAGRIAALIGAVRQGRRDGVCPAAP